MEKLNRGTMIAIGGAFAIAIGGSAALSQSDSKSSTAQSKVQQSSTIGIPLNPKSESVVASPSFIAPSSPTASPTSLPPEAIAPIGSPGPTAPVLPAAVAAPGTPLVITACNGTPGNANFRAIPNLASGSILGVVAQGETVQLTGRTVIADGELWYESIAPASLHPSTNPGALNQVQAGQTGWISGCFVRR